MRFPFYRNRDSVKNGILISIRRTGDGFHPGLFIFYILLVWRQVYQQKLFTRMQKAGNWQVINFTFRVDIHMQMPKRSMTCFCQEHCEWKTLQWQKVMMEKWWILYFLEMRVLKSMICYLWRMITKLFQSVYNAW